ncbi:MAG: hypothetical protein FJY65_11425 [Calditrichaeota bacterium]|nr:hypothetical protein [Calditrichota bacterium]
MNRRKAMTTEKARTVRQEGHDDAHLFALEIGLGRDYRNDPQAKKDVIDPSGDAHSVKSGQKRWQLFLYNRSRFLSDDGFMALNGIGYLLVHCLDVFPPNYEDYIKDPETTKNRLRTPMRELKDRFQRKALLRAFLMKSIFNGGEVNYLTILFEDKFHVFLNTEVVQVMAENFEIINSKARREGEFDDQKVLFRYKDNNVSELEVRHDSPTHYLQILFVMNIKPAIGLLFEKIQLTSGQSQN